MSKKNYYVVKNGSEPGIYDSWSECQKHIKFSKPVFQGFVTYEEAKAWLEGRDYAEERLTEDLKKYEGVIYTDGGFDKESNKYYGGYIVIDKNKQKYPGTLVQKSEKFSNEHNVSGEILACISAIEAAIKLEMQSVIIYYDYEGLEKIANGEWKTKNPTTQFYRDKIVELRGLITFDFHKVMSHTNDKYNDEVDSMAKAALLAGKGKKCKVGKNMTSISNVTMNDFDSICQKIKEELEFKITWKDISDDANKKIIRKLSYLDEVITCTFFNSTKKLVLQGKSNTVLFHVFMSLVSESIENVDIVSILSSAYEFSIDKDKIKEQEKSLFIYPKMYPANIKTLLEQSIANLNYSQEAFDYGMLTYPALKALDGHIKFMLKENGIIIGERYDIFNKNDTIAKMSKLQNGKKYVINDEKYIPIVHKYKKDIIESCYNFYKNNRDSMFHFGTVLENGLDDTKMLVNVNQAHSCIKTVLDLIGNSFSIK